MSYQEWIIFEFVKWNHFLSKEKEKMESNVYQIKSVGYVENVIKEPKDPSGFRELESKIIIYEQYKDALFRIEDSEYIQVVFYFHKSNELKNLIHNTRMGERKGNFASRSPHRINPIGLTTVQLLKKEKNILFVKGLDAIDNTPIIDIKPFTPSLDERKIMNIDKEYHINNPRAQIIDLLKKDDRKELYSAVGSLHGHYCPGSALGFHLALKALEEIRKFTDGVSENLLAIVEMNNCAVDAIQLITGCSLGNNSLIFRDLGKNALTLAIRGGKAIRVTVRNNWREQSGIDPEYTELFQKVVRDRNATQEELDRFKIVSNRESFKLIEQPSEQIVSFKEVEVILPPKAPIHESFICDKCGEMTMGSRKVIQHDNQYCLICSESPFYEITGHGIIKNHPK